jgi:hypothetical protein
MTPMMAGTSCTSRVYMGLLLKCDGFTLASITRTFRNILAITTLRDGRSQCRNHEVVACIKFHNSPVTMA